MTRLHGPDESQDDLPRPATLGERLTVTGDRLRHRHLSAFAWAAGFAPVLRRADTLSQSWAQRFDRDETGEGRPAVALRPAMPPEQPAMPPEAPAMPPGEPAVPPAEPVVSGGRQSPVPAGQPAERPKMLPADVRARLQEVAGPGAAGMRVRVDAEADAVARGQRADAVTVGTAVHLRSGRFDPDTAEGFALLAHEASHVTALLGRGVRDRSAPGWAVTEEQEARRVEGLARRMHGAESAAGDLPRAGRPGQASRPFPAAVSRPATRSAPFPANGSAPLPANGTAPLAASGAGTPMRADADRAVDAAPAPFDVEALRHSLIDDLMRRVRTDFERGG
ncbi:MAG TPA: DUF4157 domain-containing protein [Actinoplanes sp.]|nr:DUF4157 domain-containing protein [Actinoplanes sp.]